MTLGGRRVVLQRPRVRSATAGELTLPSFAFAAGRDPLDARTLEAIALGIDAEGQKHVLGLREGTTENSTVVRALLSDLVDRGLSPDRPLLFAIDGAKALRKAITAVFGSSAIVQRCQVHHVEQRIMPS